MAAIVFLLVVFAFSSTSGSSISFCEDLPEDKTYLDLSNVGINTLKESFVHSASIKCLNLANNQIGTVDSKAFAALPELESLNLAHNSIPYDDFVEFPEFPNLKTLILDKALSLNDWQYRRKHDYYYSSTQRSKLFGNVFNSANSARHFPKLEKLSCGNYENPVLLEGLSAFIVPTITHLYLTGNGVHAENELPNNLPKNLTHLYLDNNEVRNFCGIGLQHLRHLSLNNNKIEKLSAIYCNEISMTPRLMISLENLSIVGNAITSVDAEAFADSTNLVTLDLSNNKIEDFPQDTFGNMTKLRNLVLNRNRLSRVPVICALTNLETLSLDGNQISLIDETSFCNLPKLTYVDLRRNNLIDVASRTFEGLPALAKLDLSWNQIETLPEDWMGSKDSLETLNLDGNSFNDIKSMSLEGLNSLGSLSIGRNPLKSITVESLRVLPFNMTLDLTHACASGPSSM